jgi:hypothetical protein
MVSGGFSPVIHSRQFITSAQGGGGEVSSEMRRKTRRKSGLWHESKIWDASHRESKDSRERGGHGCDHHQSD